MINKNHTGGSSSSRSIDEEEKELLKVFGELLEENTKNGATLSDQNTAENDSLSNSWFTMSLAGVFVIAHGAVILSLPPVIRGKGAPYLPTSSKNMDKMFHLIRQQPQIVRKLQRATAQKPVMKFVDLGSGDGRMVFRSAREKDLFGCSIGYEINPGK